MQLSLDSDKPVRRTKHWLAIVLGSYFFVTAFNPAFITSPTVDFKSYFVASRCWMAGGNPYHFAQIERTAATQPDVTGILYPYLYPPTLAILLAPVTRLDLWWASIAWHLFSVGLTVIAALLGMRLCRAVVHDDTKPWSADLFLPIVSIGLFYVLPFSLQFEWGQVNVLVMVFIILALVQCYGRGHNISAGILLAAAALIKVTPAFLLLYFCCQRRWNVLLGFALGIVVLVTPMLFLPGGRNAWQQFFEFLPSTGYGKTIAGLYPPLGPANFSVAGFWSRLTTNETLVAGLTYASLLVLVAGVLVLHYRLRGQSSARLLLLPHLVIMVVAAPYAYLHHLTFIYPGLLLTAYALWQLPERRGDCTLYALVICTLLTSIFFPRLYSLAGLHYAFRSFNLVGLIGLYLVGLWTAEKCGLAERVGKLLGCNMPARNACE